uniref:Uncharacterized protein n=1 Tax=Salarias fasciatus TaxID=181472 RepID=A0A672HTR0_SALFA
MTSVQLLLVVSAALCAAQRHNVGSRTEWNEADRSRGLCSNLTLVLDNWKFAIMTQVKDLLLHDHDAVLPEYGRIRPLSAALADLYQEFNSLKERLSRLTAQFHGVESFVDQARSGGNLARTRAAGPEAGGRPQGRRSRVVIRRVVKAAAPPN